MPRELWGHPRAGSQHSPSAVRGVPGRRKGSERGSSTTRHHWLRCALVPSRAFPPTPGLLCFPPPCECVCVAGQGQRMVKRLQSSDFQPLASSFAIRLRRAPTDMSSLCCFSPASVSALQLHPTAPHRDCRVPSLGGCPRLSAPLLPWALQSITAPVPTQHHRGDVLPKGTHSPTHPAQPPWGLGWAEALLGVSRKILIRHKADPLLE